ncbi:hypothetical protein ACCS63_34945, partial [Rhizobium brockwellii]|uniref:hypothetical protein n=1 Tax=Rhizobium brockwellii TaxID=3019932 RepID=UPI003F9735DC
VVQDRNSGAIVALIEVDDYSHNAAHDAKRDAMTARAGYTTLRIPGRTKPTLANVRQALAPLLHPEGSVGAVSIADRQASHA